MIAARRQVWGLRLLALAIAIALWFALSFEKREARSEKVVEASVSYIRPEGLVILDPVQRVEVMLSGPIDLVNRVSTGDVGVQIDMRGMPAGTAKVDLVAENVVNLPQGLLVERIRPSMLELTLDPQVTRTLAVEPQFVGEPAAGAIMGDVSLDPPVVAVTGPQSQLSGLEAVQTAPIDLDGHAISFEESAAVVLPDILSVREIEPPRVLVRIPLQVPTPPGNDGSRRPGGRRSSE